MEITKEKDLEFIQQKKSKILPVVIIILVVILALIIFLSIYNSKSSRIRRAINNFNQAVKLSEEQEETYWHDIGKEREVIEAELEKRLDKLRVPNSIYNEFTENSEITIDFMDAYVQQYSFDDLIYGLKMISSTISLLDFNMGRKDYFYVVIDDFYTHYKSKFTDTSNCKLNSEGYYTEHPDADPKPASRQNEVSGRFNDASDGNSVYSETKTFIDTAEVYYYGDFAIKEITTNGYSQGQYGWYGGEFVDEPAHYTTRKDYVLYYKGKATSIDVESSKLPALKIYYSEDGNSFYIIYESTDYMRNDYYKKTGKIPLNLI